MQRSGVYLNVVYILGSCSAVICSQEMSYSVAVTEESGAHLCSLPESALRPDPRVLAGGDLQSRRVKGRAAGGSDILRSPTKFPIISSWAFASSRQHPIWRRKVPSACGWAAADRPLQFCNVYEINKVEGEQIVKTKDVSETSHFPRPRLPVSYP